MTDDDSQRICIEVFRAMAGLNSSPQGQAMSDAQLLADPISSFGLDSLETMEFVMGVEEKFDIMLDEDAVNKCANLGELVALVSAARRV